MSNRAWVTLATNDSYGLGALVLAHSLRRAGSAYPSVVLITPSVTDAMRQRLRAVFAEVVTVDVLDSRDAAHLALLQRPELGITFTKIHCWNLTQYEKCVFLDADILVVQNCDELFEREELSAAPDVGWPDCFNSGVFVFSPSTETFNRLIAFARERGSFDGGDQGLLNSYFSDWAHGDINKHLPFLYNVTSAAFYSYLPALKHYGQNLKIIHFIGAAKPWLQHFNWESFSVDAPDHLREFLQLWWDLFVAQIHPQLDISMVEREKAPAVPPPEQPPHDVNPHYHYQPILDPESEFPWHHPNAQLQEETALEHIDFTDINDPWEIYRGNIPPQSEEANFCHSVFERNEEQEEIRQYAWEYQSQNNDQKSNEMSVDDCEQSQHTGYYNDSYQHHRYDERSYEQCNEPQSYQQYYEPQSIQQHHVSQNYHQHYEPHNYQQHYEEHRQPQHNEHSQQVWQHEYQHQSNQDYDQYRQSIDGSHQKESNENNSQKHCDYNSCHINASYQHHYNTKYDNTYKSHDNNYEHHNKHEHSHRQEHNDERCHENHYEYFDSYKQNYSQNYDQLSNHIEQVSISNKTHKNEYYNTSNENQTVPQSKLKDTEVFNVQVRHMKKRADSSRIHRNEYGTSPSKMNGDLSDTDSDGSEEIIPRHPYDGFYLRHRAVIDSYGRKICTHEIPPAPPQSPTPPPQQVLELVNSEGDFDLPSSYSENQSGVAGNLARVVPGASGSQREALDELTRRQGWEAGNIDYMGADSFENIWAKISQTLSQPRTSPAKSPPREPTPPQPTPVEVQPPEAVPEIVAEPVELAKESPEAPAPIEATAVAEIPAQVENVASLETPLVIDAVVPVDTSLPVEAVAPVAAAVPIEVAAPVKASAPVETTVSVEAAPVDTATPVESVTTVEAITPIEKPVSTQESTELASTPAEAPAAKAGKEPAEETVVDVPVTVDAPTRPAVEIEESAPVEVATPTEVPVTVEAEEKVQTIFTTEAPVPVPVEAPQKIEIVTPIKSAPAVNEALQKPTVAPSDIPVPVETAAEVLILAEAAPEVKKTETAETPAVQPEAVVVTESVAIVATTVAPVEARPASPAVAVVASAPAPETTPPKVVPAPSSDSPPLAHTPSKEEVPAVPAAKSEERRKPAGKLQLSPPAAPDPLPTPDSEAEDAATLAHSIIASELQAAAKADTAAAPSPPTPLDRLTVEKPEVPTPPVGAVSLAQIGVKPVKGKPTIAAQIESSVAEKDDGATATAAPTETVEAPKEASKEPPKETPKKKVVKKVVKKESGASGAGGEAPVPPPRKKEKKPKEK